MLVKLTSSMAGDRFSFRPGQVIEATDDDGQRLIDHGVAVEAPDGAQCEGKLVNDERDQDRPRRKPAPETADVRAGEQVEMLTDRKCRGKTKAGNPCARVPPAGTDACAAHS